MVDDSDLNTRGSDGSQAQAMQIRVNMLQSDHAGQPIYSNLANVKAGQGIIHVDFGFLDPQSMMALNQMLQSGEKGISNVNAKMSSRLVLNIEAAHQLAIQLNQLLNRKIEVSLAKEQGISTETTSGQANKISTEKKPADEAEDSESKKAKFRFPWSKKKN